MKNDSTITSEFKRLIAFVSSNATDVGIAKLTPSGCRKIWIIKERMSEVWHLKIVLISLKEKSLAFTIAASKVPQAVTPVLEQNLKRHWSDDEIVEIMGFSIVWLFK